MQHQSWSTFVKFSFIALGRHLAESEMTIVIYKFLDIPLPLFLLVQITGQAYKSVLLLWYCIEINIKNKNIVSFVG